MHGLFPNLYVVSFISAMNQNKFTRHEPSTGLRLMLTLCALAVVSQLYVPLPILRQLAQTLHMTPGMAAAVMSAFGFAYAVGSSCSAHCRTALVDAM